MCHETTGDIERSFVGVPLGCEPSVTALSRLARARPYTNLSSQWCFFKVVAILPSQKVTQLSSSPEGWPTLDVRLQLNLVKLAAIWDSMLIRRPMELTILVTFCRGGLLRFNLKVGFEPTSSCAKSMCSPKLSYNITTSRCAATIASYPFGVQNTTTPNISSPAKATFEGTSRTRWSANTASQHSSAKNRTS